VSLDDPSTLQTILDNVASGGSIITLCSTWGVNVGRIMRWIHSDPERDKQYKQALDDRNEYRIEAILRELDFLAHVDIRKAFNEDGSLRPLKDIPQDVAQALASIEYDKETGAIHKVRFHDKIKSLELAGKNLGTFTDKVEITHKKTLEVLLSEVVEAEVIEQKALEAPSVAPA